MEERGKTVLIDALENEFGNGHRISAEIRSQVVKGYVLHLDSTMGTLCNEVAAIEYHDLCA